ncbi:hypothetical protein O6H91_01G110300 [Diphasiastrum complanatum]|uniref:Uncharacterized protein n=2 Tax=Diphasiastrum complanatum TaxID=34168 RepID=A0ACC2EUL2_DIPCM|nr:hypothetical protein O6H91_01G110300 [Diphasiastrum complanatum]
MEAASGLMSLDIDSSKKSVPASSSEANSKCNKTATQSASLHHPCSYLPLSCQSSQALSPVSRAGTSSSIEIKPTENGKWDGVAEYEADCQRVEREQKKRSKNWTKEETLRLIKLRMELDQRFVRAGRKAQLWDEIAEKMRKDCNFRDAQQCRDKWEKLSAGYKEVQHGLKNRESNPFFDELHPLLAKKSIKKEKHPKRLRWPKEKEVAPKDSAEANPDFVAKEIEEEEFQGGGNPREGSEGVEEFEAGVLARKKRKSLKYIAATDLAVVQSFLESVTSKYQIFFKDLLDSMERRQQQKEQLRDEIEERWRAEDRAQRCVFNSAMILLTQNLLGNQAGNAGAGPATVHPSSPDRPQAPKKRSENWNCSEVLQMIKIRGQIQSRFSSSTRRMGLWEEVAELLVADGVRRDAKQCKEKWDKLMAAYKDVADGKRERRDSPYFAELTAIVGRRPAE